MAVIKEDAGDLGPVAPDRMLKELYTGDIVMVRRIIVQSTGTTRYCFCKRPVKISLFHLLNPIDLHDK